MKNTAFAAAFIAAVALAACTKTEKTQETTVASADTAVVIETDTTPLASGKSAGWNDLDYNMPEVRVPTIRLPQVTVHANEHLASYALGDNILFKLDEATLSKEGASDLKSVADNIEERLPGSQIRIYGYADTTGSKAYNKELSMKRARHREAVPDRRLQDFGRPNQHPGHG